MARRLLVLAILAALSATAGGLPVVPGHAALVTVITATGSTVGGPSPPPHPNV